MIFDGVSLFLWQLGEIFKTQDPAVDLERFSESVSSLKLGGVYVKVADGAVPFNLTRRTQAQWQDSGLRAMLEQISRCELAKIGWHYLYGREPEKEAERALERINRLGLQGYILDVEQEYKTAGSKAAELFMKRLRAGSSIPLALCSYRFPSLHRDFPWQTFASWLDADKGDCHMPQVYWVGDRRENGPGLQLQRCHTELMAVKALPLVPIGGLYSQSVNGQPWQPSRVQIQNFVQTARLLKCPGLSWWSWDSVSKADGPAAMSGTKVGWWQEIQQAAALWKGELTEEKITLEIRVKQLETQAKLHGWMIEQEGG
jgi:hypothetical protein